MGEIFKALGTAASVLIPGAAPIVAGVTGLVSALQRPAAPPPDAPAGAPIDQTTYLGGTLFGGGGYPYGPVRPRVPIGPGMVGILGDTRFDPTGGMQTPSDLESVIAAGPLEAPRTWLPSVATIPPSIATDSDVIQDMLRRIGQGGGPMDVIAPGIGGLGRLALGAYGLGGGGVRGVIAAAERVLPKILIGTAAGTAIYELYARLRGAGHGHKRARRLALQAAGYHLRRRRMRPTNVHALRRAIRRVHGFQRIARKVGALHVGRRRLLAAPRYGRRRHYRRGDVSPFMVEDWVDEVDEAEDLGLEPDQFQETVAE